MCVIVIITSDELSVSLFLSLFFSPFFEMMLHLPSSFSFYRGLAIFPSFIGSALSAQVYCLPSSPSYPLLLFIPIVSVIRFLWFPHQHSASRRNVFIVIDDASLRRTPSPGTRKIGTAFFLSPHSFCSISCVQFDVAAAGAGVVCMGGSVNQEHGIQCLDITAGPAGISGCHSGGSKSENTSPGKWEPFHFRSMS